MVLDGGQRGVVLVVVAGRQLDDGVPGAAIVAAREQEDVPLGAVARRRVVVEGDVEVAAADRKGWKPTWIKQADGKGGWMLHPAQIQFLHYGEGVSGKTHYHDSKFIQSRDAVARP